MFLRFCVVFFMVAAIVGQEMSPRNSHEGSPINARNSHEGNPIDARNSHESSFLDARNSHESSFFDARNSHEGSPFDARNSHEGSPFDARNSHETRLGPDAVPQGYAYPSPPATYYNAQAPSAAHYAMVSSALAQLSAITQNSGGVEYMVQQQGETIRKLGDVLKHLSQMLASPAMEQMKKQSAILTMFSQVLGTLSSAVQAMHGPQAYGPAPPTQSNQYQQYYTPAPSYYPVPTPPPYPYVATTTPGYPYAYPVPAPSSVNPPNYQDHMSSSY